MIGGSLGYSLQQAHIFLVGYMPTSHRFKMCSLELTVDEGPADFVECASQMNQCQLGGIGSGIVRILAECPNLDIVNDSDGNEFKVTIFRGGLDTIQKDDFTIQKTDFATQKNETTTQKDETTTQKNKTTTQKDEITTQKKILDFLKINPKATRVEIAQALGDITADGVKFIIAKLQQKGLLKRVGGRKHDEWVVCHDENK